jgi:hypothetical protein
MNKLKIIRLNMGVSIKDDSHDNEQIDPYIQQCIDEDMYDLYEYEHNYSLECNLKHYQQYCYNCSP